MDETEREMWEIAENLHRVDLTKEERDKHIRRYAELVEEKEKKAKPPQSGEVSQINRGHGGRGKKGIVQKVADDTGLGRETVRRALNPPLATDPTKKPAPPDQEMVYRKLCHWWGQADAAKQPPRGAGSAICFPARE